jgi:hypothetical protein
MSYGAVVFWLGIFIGVFVSVALQMIIATLAKWASGGL